MSELKGKVGQKGRILYVEPNSVFGKIGNVPLTPDYSDLCISFNLIVEVNMHVLSSSTRNWLIERNDGQYLCHRDCSGE